MSLAEARKPPAQSTGAGRPPLRQLSHQFSDLAKTAIMSQAQSSPVSPVRPVTVPPDYERVQSTQHVPSSLDASHHEYHASLMPPPTNGLGRTMVVNGTKPLPHPSRAMGAALTDTPMPSQPGSPQM